jgi:PII-like signaling protein
MKQQQDERELTIYIGEDDQWHGKPLYTVLIDKLREAGITGATIVKGIEGYGVHKKLHSNKVEALFQGMPLLIRVIDKKEKIAGALAAIDDILVEALVTVNDITSFRYTPEPKEV